MKTKLGVVILAVAFVGLLIALFAMKHTADERFKNGHRRHSRLFKSGGDGPGQPGRVGSGQSKADQRPGRQPRGSTGFQQPIRRDLRRAGRHQDLAPKRPGPDHQSQPAHRRFDNAESGARPARGGVGRRHRQPERANQSIRSKSLPIPKPTTPFSKPNCSARRLARAELEGKFNNLTVVRAQVKKLKEDVFVARRMQWQREGTEPGLQAKGGQQLMQRTPPTPAHPPHYDLNVEVSSDGAIRVMPASTNAPTTTANPTQ